jgi:AAA+ superfamily predicted ATPase
MNTIPDENAFMNAFTVIFQQMFMMLFTDLFKLKYIDQFKYPLSIIISYLGYQFYCFCKKNYSVTGWSFFNYFTTKSQNKTITFSRNDPLAHKICFYILKHHKNKLSDYFCITPQDSSTDIPLSRLNGITVFQFDYNNNIFELTYHYHSTSGECYKLRCVSKPDDFQVIEDFILDVVKNKSEDTDKIRVYTHTSGTNSTPTKWVGQLYPTNKTLSNVIVTKEVRTQFHDDISRFINSKALYKKRGDPYQRAYLVHGPPGTGKTCSIKAITSYYKMDTFFFDINTINTNEQLVKLVADAYALKSGEVCLFLFEDMDRSYLFNTEIKPPESWKVTMECFMNVLDGLTEAHGRLVIISANNIEPIMKHTALVRKGRIDQSVMFDYCVESQLEDLCNLRLENKELKELVMELFRKKNVESKVTTSQIIEVLKGIDDTKVDTTVDVFEQVTIKLNELFEQNIVKNK